MTNVGPGDRVVITEMEHHSNLVPWQLLVRADRRDARLGHGRRRRAPATRGARREARPAATSSSSPSRTSRTSSGRSTRSTRSPAGRTPPVRSSSSTARRRCRRSRSTWRAIDADFYAWTGHKAYGPTGIGVLHGRRALLDAMPPFITGGHMIASVSLEKGTRWAETPAKFEAGTSAIAETIGLGAAVDFLSRIGMDAVREHESRPRRLRARAALRGAGPARAGPARGRGPRRARLVHARRRAPARRRRDPRPRRASASGPGTTAPSRS